MINTEGWGNRYKYALLFLPIVYIIPLWVWGCHISKLQHKKCQRHFLCKHQAPSTKHQAPSNYTQNSKNRVKPSAWLFQGMDLLSALADGRVNYPIAETLPPPDYYFFSPFCKTPEIFISQSFLNTSLRYGADYCDKRGGMTLMDFNRAKRERRGGRKENRKERKRGHG